MKNEGGAPEPGATLVRSSVQRRALYRSDETAISRGTAEVAGETAEITARSDFPPLFSAFSAFSA
jgi:hypothetical protein